MNGSSTSGGERLKVKQFVDHATARYPDKVAIDDIVYLDDDQHTYKYFMTGKFDAEAKARDIATQAANTQAAKVQAAASEERPSRDSSVDPNDASGSFYNKLVALNDKIGVFQD